MEYSTHPFLTENFAAFSDYQAAGIPHLFHMFDNCFTKFKDPELVFRQVVHTYKTGTESEVIEGEVPIATSSGIPYAVRLGWRFGDKVFYLNGAPDSKKFGNVENFIYYWPNRANGQPYYIPNE